MKSIEVAKLAGVSRSTVSRVINNYPNVPPETREKVMKIIEEYNYMPNSYARTLAGKKNNTIGLFFIISEADAVNERLFRNDYFAAYLDILVDMASERDYYVLISLVTDETKYSKINQAFHEKRIDGGIIIGTQENTLSHLVAHGLDTSIVLFDYDVDMEAMERFDKTQFTVINSNDEEGIFRAVQHLYELGHREIGFIRGREASRSGHIRRLAFAKAMEGLNLRINDSYCLDGDFHVDTVYEELSKRIKEGQKLPTAYISANDYMALGAIRAFNENNISVPGDISIIGFDNTHRAQEFNPKLTTMGPDFYKMAQKAIDILDNQIKAGDHYQPLQTFDYEVEFFIRDTCKKIDA